MAKGRSVGGGHRQAHPPADEGRKAPASPEQPKGDNRRLAEQTRKLLGRHYAAKYPGPRSR